MASIDDQSYLISQEKYKRAKHWFWDSWVLMSASAAIIFAMRAILIAEFSQLAFEGLYYMGFGPVPLCIVYFILNKEWKKKNISADKYN